MCARSHHTHTPLPDTDLIALFNQWWRLAFHAARRHCRDDLAERAEDIAGSALLSLWTNRRAFDPARPTRSGKPAFGAWVCHRVRSLVQHARLTAERRERMLGERGHRMGAGGEPSAYPDAKARTPDQIAERAELDAAVEKAKRRLTAKQREAIEARLERRKLHQIDPTVTPEAVRQRCVEGAKAIRGELAAFDIN